MWFICDVQLPKIVHNVCVASTHDVHNKLRGFQQPRLLAATGKQNNTCIREYSIRIVNTRAPCIIVLRSKCENTRKCENVSRSTCKHVFMSLFHSVLLDIDMQLQTRRD